MEPVQTINFKTYTIHIVPDDNPESPRDWDNITEFHCSHRRYNLGDKGFNYPSGSDCIQAVKLAEKQGDIVLPLYLYDHSGITISLSPFSCPWDSGQVGFVIVRREKMLQEFSAHKFTKSLKDKALKIAQNEVQTYDQYLRGEVYGYKIEKQGEQVDSCWGYYGLEDCISEAKISVKFYAKEEIKQHCQKVKQWILNKVPLIYRSSIA